MTRAILYLPPENEFLFKIDNKQTVLVIGQVQSGKTKFMQEQSRLAFYNEYDTVILLGGSNNNLLEQTRTRFEQVFERNDEMAIIEIENTKYSQLPEKKCLITSLKGIRSLEKLYEMLINSTKRKVLIFDDESDFGSINIKNPANPSKIHAQIIEIKNAFNEGTFVAVTATPFADIMLNKDDFFSSIFLLKPNDEYTGSDFFQKNNIYIETEVTKDTREIKENQADWLKIILSHIQRIYDSNLPYTQMVINNDLSKQFHKLAAEKIAGILILLKERHPHSYLPKKYEINVVNKIIKELLSNIYILNGESNAWNDQKHSIIIGGTLVSRGYTFEKLLTTIMYNEPQNKMSADTMLQRARWFGYRKEISKFMHVYISNKAIECYAECDKLVKELENLIYFHKNNVKEIKKGLNNLRSKFEIINLTGKKERPNHD
ncbi:hypothetical protein ESOMN_v1c05980 [Williamsoniiplasma somnilux]|uniref:Uncharacterized protein n=1 Tax=Williamsoniiplasma somnilux TaxID=215578 RepID=A0A2K8NYT3_9MOLU|nr:Z1 domain-containing protein [Williamsoniiplasma somnilux]ATZ18980.1 hypothetical protein ESOMN_v1c05980 [Williamsoniiplasma somnilux]